MTMQQNMNSSLQYDSSQDVSEVANDAGVEVSGDRERFEIKRWNACAVWAWDVMHDTCVICRNGMMTLCIHCQARAGSAPAEDVCSIAWGVCNHAYHLHCIKRWLESSVTPRCPLDNSAWEFRKIGQ